MVSQKTTDDRETDRRKLLAGYLYDCSKMMYGSVAVGGLSPLLTGGHCRRFIKSAWCRVWLVAHHLRTLQII